MRRPMILVALAVSLVGACRHRHERLRIATFNIRDYPESPRQEAGAFALLGRLGIAAAGVQEITDPWRFGAAARRHLGRSWLFIWPDLSPDHRVGVLWDDRALELLSTRSYRETVVYPGGKPAFEARLRPRRGGKIVRLIVVHLKAGGDGGMVRGRQLAGLTRPLLEAMASGERVVLLGDFNATDEKDRRVIETVAQNTAMAWSSESLACTSYWDRDDGCVGSALDHVLAWQPVTTAARGPCETDGCAMRNRCPTYHAEVSDHCPVTIDLP